jgi:TctA family transporter
MNRREFSVAALAISQGDPSVFLSHPISATLPALAAAVTVGPWIYKVVGERRR